MGLQTTMRGSFTQKHSYTMMTLNSLFKGTCILCLVFRTRVSLEAWHREVSLYIWLLVTLCVLTSSEDCSRLRTCLAICFTVAE